MEITTLSILHKSIFELSINRFGWDIFSDAVTLDKDLKYLIKKCNLNIFKNKLTLSNTGGFGILIDDDIYNFKNEKELSDFFLEKMNNIRRIKINKLL